MKLFIISWTVWIAQSLVVFQCNLILFQLNAGRTGQETSCLDDCAVWRFMVNLEFVNYSVMSGFTLVMCSNGFTQIYFKNAHYLLSQQQLN